VNFPRNIDYALAVNTYSAFHYIKMGKLKQSLSFICEAEEDLKRLIGFQLLGVEPADLQEYRTKV
jgi:hypothetical protein